MNRGVGTIGLRLGNCGGEGLHSGKIPLRHFFLTSNVSSSVPHCSDEQSLVFVFKRPKRLRFRIGARLAPKVINRDRKATQHRLDTSMGLELDVEG